MVFWSSVIFFLASVLFSCKSASNKHLESSAIKHDASQPTVGTEPFHWSATTVSEFDVSSQKAPFRHDVPLPPDHPTVKRLQLWTDRIHEAVEKDYLAKNSGPFPAPKPVINVVPSEEANGWVSGIVSCVDYPVDIDLHGGSPREPKHFKDRIRIAYDAIEFPRSFFGVPATRCAYPSNWPRGSDGKADPQLFVEFFNKQNPKCKLSFANGRFRVYGDGCSVEGNDYTSADRISIYSASPFIHITSSMVHNVDKEEAILSTLAHELGHYYRSHAIALLSGDAYDYWYPQILPPSARKPIAAPNSKELEKEFRSVMPRPMPEVPGQYYGFYITEFILGHLTGELRNMCSKSSPCACSEYLKFVENNGDSLSKLSCFSCSYVASEVKDSYLKAESLLKACAKDVRVISSGQSTGSLSLESLNAGLSAYVKGFSDSPPSGQDLAQVLDELKKRADARIERKSDFTNRVREERLGKYTVEQEADDFSLEYLSRLGLPPKRTIGGRLDQYATIAKQNPQEFEEVNGISMQACYEAFQKGFRNSDGSYSYIPLGDLHSVHHGGCYRAYNMTLENDAHGYDQSLGSLEANAPTSPSWEAALEAAKKATQSFGSMPTLPGGPGGPRFMPLPASGEKSSLIIN